MKRLFFTMFAFFVCVVVSADDVIVLRSSKRISANILEVSKTEVRYKEASNPDGPTFVLDTDDILSVIYSSGTVQNFEQRPKEVSEWEYEEIQEAQRKQAAIDRRDSLAQAKLLKQQLMKQRRDSAKTEKLARWESYPWTNMILANGSFSIDKTFGFGLTYARVKQFGFYISAMSGINFRFSEDYKVNNEYYLYRNDPEQYSSYIGYPFYTGKKEVTSFALTAGAMFRLKVPLYFYLGAGYGYLSRYYELAGTGKWVSTKGTPHGISAEYGLRGNIKGFGISLGVQLLYPISGNMTLYGKLGLGYCF